MTDEIDTIVYPDPPEDEVNPPDDMEPDVKSGVPEEPSDEETTE